MQIREAACKLRPEAATAGGGHPLLCSPRSARSTHQVHGEEEDETGQGEAVVQADEGVQGQQQLRHLGELHQEELACKGGAGGAGGKGSGEGGRKGQAGRPEHGC